MKREEGRGKGRGSGKKNKKKMLKKKNCCTTQYLLLHSSSSASTVLIRVGFSAFKHYAFKFNCFFPSIVWRKLDEEMLKNNASFCVCFLMQPLRPLLLRTFVFFMISLPSIFLLFRIAYICTCPHWCLLDLLFKYCKLKLFYSRC